MNTIIIAGRLTKNAESKQAGGETVVSFGVAEDVFVNKEKTAQFYDCDFWGKRAASVAQYLEKGSPVTVTGSLTKHEHNGKTYLKVRVNDVALQGGKREASSNYGTSGNGANAKHTAPVEDGNGIPF